MRGFPKRAIVGAVAGKIPGGVLSCPKQQRMSTYVPERLYHLGIVAGVCQELGLADDLDGLDTSYHVRVSVGTATVAMNLHGLGFSNRRLYLAPQFSPRDQRKRSWVQASPPTISMTSEPVEKTSCC